MKTGIRVLALLASGSVACTSAPARLSERAQDSVRVQAPGPGDSLAELSRQFLVDPDPVTVGQAILCEHVRLSRVYGHEESFRISQRVRDTIYTSGDRQALRRAEAAVGGRVFTTNCDRQPDTTQTQRDSAVDTLRIRVTGGPSDRKFFRIVRPKGYRVAYAFVADTGFQNLLVMVGNDLVPSKGEVVVGKGQVLIVSADRAVRLRPENTKLFDLLRAQLTAKDPVMAHRRVSCEMDRLLTLYSGARADTLIREAEFLAIDPIRDREALRRVDRALAGKTFRVGCDTTQSRK